MCKSLFRRTALNLKKKHAIFISSDSYWFQLSEYVKIKDFILISEDQFSLLNIPLMIQLLSLNITSLPCLLKLIWCKHRIVVTACEISLYKWCVFFSFFTTSKLCGELNALLMLCHGGIHDLRASKWSMTYGKGFWVKQTQSWSHLVLSDQSLSVSLQSYVAEMAVKTERWLWEQGDESSIMWRMEKL